MIRDTHLSHRIRSNVWAILACFAAGMGTAVVASANEEPPQAAASAAGKKQIKQLKRKLAAVEARLAALEGGAGSPSPPTGPAGGDLTGTYPSPQIGPQAVGASEIVNGSVGTSQLANAVQITNLDVNDLDVGDSLFGSPAFFGLGGQVAIRGNDGAIDLEEVASPGNPVANAVRIYARDSGGLTQLVARFADGNIDVLAAEAP